MTKATSILKAAIKADKTTRKGLTATKLMRGRYSKCFVAMSQDLYDGAMRTFDRTIGNQKPEAHRTSEERAACK